MRNSHRGESLERLIDAAARGVPRRSAPPTLEERVLRAIDARAATPWWRKDFAHWPMLARLLFVAAAVGVIALVLGAPSWIWESSREALPPSVSLMQTLAQIPRLVVKHLPSLLVFGGLALLALLYAALFGLGAVAYRSLFTRSGN